MRFQNEGLQIQLKESKTHEKFLQQEVTKTKEKYADLNQMYEKLKTFSNFKEVENQLEETLSMLNMHFGPLMY